MPSRGIKWASKHGWEDGLVLRKTKRVVRTGMFSHRQQATTSRQRLPLSAAPRTAAHRPHQVQGGALRPWMDGDLTLGQKAAKQEKETTGKPERNQRENKTDPTRGTTQHKSTTPQNPRQRLQEAEPQLTIYVKQTGNLHLTECISAVRSQPQFCVSPNAYLDKKTGKPQTRHKTARTAGA